MGRMLTLAELIRMHSTGEEAYRIRLGDRWAVYDDLEPPFHGDIGGKTYTGSRLDRTCKYALDVAESYEGAGIWLSVTVACLSSKSFHEIVLWEDRPSKVLVALAEFNRIGFGVDSDWGGYAQ